MWSNYIDTDVMTNKKPSQIPSSGLSCHRRISPAVAMIFNPSPLLFITPTTLPSDVPS